MLHFSQVENIFYWWNKNDNKNLPHFNPWYDSASTNVLCELSNYIQLHHLIGAACTADSLTLYFGSESTAVLHCVLVFLIHHDILFNGIFILLKYKNNFKYSCIY